jgi:hypothetical protein
MFRELDPKCPKSIARLPIGGGGGALPGSHDGHIREITDFAKESGKEPGIWVE